MEIVTLMKKHVTKQNLNILAIWQVVQIVNIKLTFWYVKCEDGMSNTID